MMSPHDHDDCEVRYRDVLGRLGDLSREIDGLAHNQRMIVDLLRDFRDLIRLVAGRVRALDRRVAEVAARPHLFHPDERIARHFRN